MRREGGCRECRGCKKHLTYRGIKIRIKSDFSSKTIQIRREWGGIFTVEKRKKKTNYNSVSYKIILLKSEGEILSRANKN